MDEKDIKKAITDATDNEDLKKLHSETKEDLGNFAGDIASKIEDIEGHAKSNKILNITQVGDMLQRRESDRKLDEVAKANTKGIEQEQRHNKGAKESRKRIEASLDSLHRKVEGGVRDTGGGEPFDNDPDNIPGNDSRPQETGARAQGLAQVMGNIMPTKISSDAIKGGASANLKLMAQADSTALEQAILRDKEGEGDLVKRINRVLEATRKQETSGDSKEAKDEIAKLAAYEQRTGINSGLDTDALMKGTQNQGFFSGQNFKEMFNISQGDDFTAKGAAGGLMSGFIDKLNNSKFGQMITSQDDINEKEKQELIQGEASRQDQKSVSDSLEAFLKGEDFQKRDPEKIDPRKALVGSRTGQDTETIQEKQLEVLEEIRDLLADMQGGGGMDMPMGPPMRPGQTRTPQTRTPRNVRPRGPQVTTRPGKPPTNVKVPRGGFTTPPKGVPSVQAKSGKWFPTNSPQGQTIQNMTKTVTDVADDVKPPSGLSKVARVAGKALGVGAIALDAGFRIKDDMEQRDLLERAQAGDETAIDTRTGELYSEDSADADRAENVSGFATGTAGAIAGAKVGAALGTFAGPVGTVVGGVVGAGVGYVAASSAGTAIADAFTTNDAEKEVKKLEIDGAFEKVIWGESKINREKMKEVGTDKNIQSLLSEEGDDLSADDISFLEDLQDQKRNTEATMEKVAMNTSGNVGMTTDAVTGQAKVDTVPTADAIGNMTDLSDGLELAANQPVINIGGPTVTGGGDSSQAIAAIMKANSRFPLDSSMTRVFSNYKIV